MINPLSALKSLLPTAAPAPISAATLDVLRDLYQRSGVAQDEWLLVTRDLPYDEGKGKTSPSELIYGTPLEDDARGRFSIQKVKTEFEVKDIDAALPQGPFSAWVRGGEAAVYDEEAKTVASSLEAGTGHMPFMTPQQLSKLAFVPDKSVLFPAGPMDRLMLMEEFGTPAMESMLKLPMGRTTAHVFDAAIIFVHEDVGVLGVLGR